MAKSKKKGRGARVALVSDSATELMAISKKKGREDGLALISDSETELMETSKKKGRDARVALVSDSETELMAISKKKGREDGLALVSDSETELMETSKKKGRDARVALVSDSETESMAISKKKGREDGLALISDSETELMETSKKKRRNARVVSDSETESDSDHENQRGRTVLTAVRKAIDNGEKISLEWNASKVPCGEHRITFGTYVGVIARERVNINFEEWGHLPPELVNEVYNEITKGFTVLPDRRGWVVSRVSERWRAFKCRLVKNYLYKKSGKIRKMAPSKYPFISQNDWEKFTAYCTSDKFKEKSEKNRARANMKTTRYRGGRKGYQHYEKEIVKEFESQGIHIEKVPRHLSWLKAHANKSDQSYAPGDLEIAEAIKTLDAQAGKGVFSATGRDDILAKVLRKPEHGGAVRGVGSGITNKEYFGPAERPKLGQMMEQIQALQSQVTRMANMQQFMMAYFMGCSQPSTMQFPPEQMRQFMAGGVDGQSDQVGGSGGQVGSGGHIGGSGGQVGSSGGHVGSSGGHVGGSVGQVGGSGGQVGGSGGQVGGSGGQVGGSVGHIGGSGGQVGGSGGHVGGSCAQWGGGQFVPFGGGGQFGPFGGGGQFGPFGGGGQFGPFGGGGQFGQFGGSGQFGPFGGGGQFGQFGGGGQFGPFGGGGQFGPFGGGGQFGPFGGGGPFAGNRQNVPESLVSSEPRAHRHEPEKGHVPEPDTGDVP
ncbi:uncharacterized protein [Spinacia oleracea]|uniref:Uncharacterized protein LOC110785510 isoform X2 n=1 Tax=Spinacia oleracea TaxID=3562 RepID=A0A9R0IAE4_SPIOL|nr:uncharacterized protein LOC110785510 isoform X4 [Spinacia oleracea]XP_056695967.1 uncharacterized protein LOC110785510 isoform X3 [Spinacia oleracea]